jgi:prepilin-type N-terminal cleavage/methylation domain-containing protein/prepilin-type processing-associated H-X9-DG protein
MKPGACEMTPIWKKVRGLRPAFTVIELMVVIGIIGVLVGITLPALRTFRMEAFYVNCQRNLRELGGIMQTYQNQHQGGLPMVEFLPAVTDDGPVGGLPWAFRGFMDRENKCWCCPADHDEADSLSTGTSYFYMPGLIRYTPNVQIQVQQAMLATMLDPTLTPEQREKVRMGIEARLVTAFYRNDYARLPVLADSIDRHPGTRIPRNALYFDGSVGISTDYSDIVDDDDDDDDDG